jgi:hypothetical protein
MSRENSKTMRAKEIQGIATRLQNCHLGFMTDSFGAASFAV